MFHNKQTRHIVFLLGAALVIAAFMLAGLAVYNYHTSNELKVLHSHGQVEQAQSIEKNKEFVTDLTLTAVLSLLFLAWMIGVHLNQLGQEVLFETNQQLSKRTEELAELTHTLDEKVHERTVSLRGALAELQKAHDELQTAQSQLLQSEKFSAIGQLAAGIAHEINNPIGFINSNLQTLTQYVANYTSLFQLREKFDEAIKNKNLEQATSMLASVEKFKRDMNFHFINGDVSNLLRESREGAEKIRKIVVDLRTFASADKEVMDKVKVDAIIESMINIVWNEIKYKAQLKKEYAVDLPLITCNPQKIAQVIVILLMNAAQAIEEKGEITIKTYTKDQYVCIDVSDTGSGILPQNATKIFDPFFTTKPVGQGTGLGLSISYDIVKKHGGNITFKSKVGEGTTFTVMLPQGDVL